MPDAKQMHFKSVHYASQRANPTQPSKAPRLIITGAVHGNETCGTRAIERVMAEIDSGALALIDGSVTFVPVVNPLAYAKSERSGDRNLNRNLFPNDAPQDFEDRIANWLCPLLAQHDVLLDLHSFNANSEPFCMVGPRDNHGSLQPFRHEAKERALARVLGVRRFVDGWLQTYGQGVQRRLRKEGQGSQLELVLRYGVGTTEYMRSTGGYALTLECGQHADPQAPEVAYRAIINTLTFLGLVDSPAPQAVAAQDMEALSMVEVHDKLDAADQFSRSWSSFDRLAEGDEIGRRADGTPVLAPFDSLILFPDAKANANSEWYYLAQANPAF